LPRLLNHFSHTKRLNLILTHSSFWRASQESDCWKRLDIEAISYECTDQIFRAALDRACDHVEDLDLKKCIHLTDKSLHLVAERCPALQHITIDGTLGFRQTNFTDEGVSVVIKACNLLSSITIRCTTDVRDKSITALAMSLCASRITHLDLMGNMQITDDAVSSLVVCTSLSHLCLESCRRLTSAGIERLLSGSPSLPLKSLNLSSCIHVGDGACRAINNTLAASLEKLALDNCMALTDHGLLALSVAPFRILSSLSLAGCKKVTAAGLLPLASALGATLTELSIERVPQAKADMVVQLVERLPRLQSFSKGMLNDRALREICPQLLHLRSLVLGSSKDNGTISDEGLGALQVFHSLHTLDLSGIHRCEAIHDAARHWPQLQRLNMVRCSARGTTGMLEALQADATFLPNLRHITLSAVEEQHHRLARGVAQARGIELAVH